MEKFEKQLENFAYQVGADVFGIADVKQIEGLQQEFQGFSEDWSSIVVVGVRLPLAIVRHITPEEPGKIYSYEYNVMSELLDRIVFSLVAKLEDSGWSALPIPSRGGYPPKGGSLLAMARAAGIGSFGKNQLITHERFGSRLRFAALVTTRPMETATPKKEDLCGDCTSCIDACPAHAIHDVPFTGSDLRKGGIDREACWNHVKAFLDKSGYEKTICGVCIAACPYSNKL